MKFNRHRYRNLSNRIPGNRHPQPHREDKRKQLEAKIVEHVAAKEVGHLTIHLQRSVSSDPLRECSPESILRDTEARGGLSTSGNCSLPFAIAVGKVDRAT